MKTVILYRLHSESASRVESFVHDFQQRHEAGNLEVVDADSREGSAVATLYGIMEYPAILVLKDDGAVLQAWQGDTLPLMDDLAYYTSQA